MGFCVQLPNLRHAVNRRFRVGRCLNFHVSAASVERDVNCHLEKQNSHPRVRLRLSNGRQQARQAPCRCDQRGGALPMLLTLRRLTAFGVADAGQQPSHGRLGRCAAVGCFRFGFGYASAFAPAANCGTCYLTRTLITPGTENRGCPGEIWRLIHGNRLGLRRSVRCGRLSPDVARDPAYSHARPSDAPFLAQTLGRLTVSSILGYRGVASALSVATYRGWLR
jgi:hypothetical protein